MEAGEGIIAYSTRNLSYQNFKLEFGALCTLVFFRPISAVPWRFPL